MRFTPAAALSRRLQCRCSLLVLRCGGCGELVSGGDCAVCRRPFRAAPPPSDAPRVVLSTHPMLHSSAFSAVRQRPANTPNGCCGGWTFRILSQRVRVYLTPKCSCAHVCSRAAACVHAGVPSWCPWRREEGCLQVRADGGAEAGPSPAVAASLFPLSSSSSFSVLFYFLFSSCRKSVKRSICSTRTALVSGTVSLSPL